MKRPFLSLIILSLLLGACANGSATPTPTESGNAETVRPVSVSGKVVPMRWAALAFQRGGTLASLDVEEGQNVIAGQKLAVLDDTEAQWALRAATEALALQQANLALAQAAPQAADVAAATAQLEAARAALKALEEAPTARDLEEARLVVEQAKNTLWATQLQGNIPGLPVSAQQAARAEAAVAEQALALAQSQYERVQEGPSNEALASGRAAVAQAEALLDQLRRGSSAERLEVLRAAVRAAQVEVDRVAWALTLNELHSPFVGTVTAVSVRQGELVSPGQPVLTVADLTSLRVETTDLDEADLSRVQVGQAAEITLDAIPGQVLAGRVTKIASMIKAGQGSSSFALTIELDRPDPRLRWGMTAFVDILAK